MLNGNIRSTKGLDDSELRESLKSSGWNKHLPAIKDEHGKIIVGHRRLKIAEEENIEPVIRVLTFGEGKDADNERLQLAVVSNIGAASLTIADRKRLAERLYKDGMTMAAIGEVLGVSKFTISNDLKDVVREPNNAKREPIIDKLGRKNTGRPKKTRAERSPRAVEREERVAVLHDAGLSRAEISAKTGIHSRVVDQAMEHVEIAREAAAMAGLQTSREDLSMSAQKKFDAAIRAYQRKLDVAFEKRVADEIKKLVNETILPYHNERHALYNKVINLRRGLIKRPVYNLIRSCLHADSRLSASAEKLNKAFQAFNDLEQVLLDESECPTEGKFALPKSFAEMMERKMAAQAARKNKRQPNQVRRR